MSWAKRNLYFLIGCIVAVLLLGAAGWFCFTEMQGNSQSMDALTQAYSQLNDISKKTPTPNRENIEAAHAQVKDIQAVTGDLRNFLAPIPPYPVGKVDDRTLAFAVRETIRDLRIGAGANITLPADYAFSFAVQRDKTVYAPQSWGQLAQELGEVRTICGILYSNRINSLDSIQRERNADDLAASGDTTTAGPDYLDLTSVTNNNTVQTPYRISFQCFDAELGGVLASFANQPYGIIVRTLDIAPADLVTADMNEQTPGTAPGGFAASAPILRGGLPVIVDEKKLKVTMLLEVVRLLPTPGR